MTTAAAVAAVMALVIPLALPYLRAWRGSELLLALVLILVAGGRDVAGLNLPFTPLYYAELLLLLGIVIAARECMPVRTPTLLVGLPLFVLLETARTLTTLEPGQALPPVLQQLGLIEYLLFAVVGVSLRPPRWSYLSAAVLAAGQVTGALSLLAYQAGAYSLTSNGSARFLSSNQVIAASLALVVLCLKPDLGTLRRTLLAILPGVSLLLVYQRTSWLSAVVGIAVAWLLARRLHNHGGTRSLQRVGAALVLAGLLAASPWGRTSAEEALQRVTGIAVSQDANVAFRLGVQREQLDQWSRSPVVGVGFLPQVSRSTPGGGVAAVNGHNAWVTLLWRVGLLGFSVVVLTYGTAVIRAAASRTRTGAFIAGGLMLVAVGTSFNVWLDVPYVAPLAWFLVGLALRGEWLRDQDTHVAQVPARARPAP